MPQGISPNPLNKISEVYLSQISEHHKKDADGNTIPHEDELDEAKYEAGASTYGKASIRNYRRMGPGYTEPGMFDPEGKRGKTIEKRREEHKARRGVKGAKVPAYKVDEGSSYGLYKGSGKAGGAMKKYLDNAKKMQDADKKKREAVDARNQADTLLHSTEKNLKEHGSKVSDADKKAIDDASANLRNALKGTDVEEIKKKTQDLVQASMKLGEAIYKSQQSAKPEDKNNSTKEDKKDDNVVDADFEEVKEENKEKSA